MAANPLETVDARDVDAVLRAAGSALCQQIRDSAPLSDLSDLIALAAEKTHSGISSPGQDAIISDLGSMSVALYGSDFSQLAAIQQLGLIGELLDRVRDHCRLAA